MPDLAFRAPSPASNLCFLTCSSDIRGLAALILGVAALAAAGCETRSLTGSMSQDPDAGKAISPPGPHPTPINCANAGCGAPPLCGQSCTAACGCCPCAEGQLFGDLLCKGGCLMPVPASDGGAATAPDAHIAGWKPPESCLLPFDVGPCDAAIRVFAFVDGACVQKGYGGCAGNANRFATIEECMATCEGRPAAFPCPAARVAQQICVMGGLAGGCGKYATVCAQPCGPTQQACPSTLSFCIEGVCQTISPE